MRRRKGAWTGHGTFVALPAERSYKLSLAAQVELLRMTIAVLS
jgi:hypothetical protein